ncbi:MAG: type VI secretion system protein TssA [Chlorobiota bacterium]|nr:MAG: type VI secretion system protein TssA [Chlorobiota bacterium]
MAIVEIEHLVEPISEDAPAGTDQSATPQYLQIIDAMREDDPTIAREQWEQPRTADWAKVQQLCEELLETKTKDLQVAIWLCQALLHNYGIEGLNDGILLTGVLCQNYWEWLYPVLEEPNLLYRRTNLLTKFFNKLDEQLRSLKLTQPSDPELQPYTWGDYLDTSHIDRLDDQEKRRAIEQGRATTEMFSSSLRSTADDYIVQLAAGVAQSQLLLGELESIVQQRCEELRPLLEDATDADFSLGAGKEALNLLGQFLQRVCTERGIGSEGDAESEASPEVGDESPGSSRGSISALGTREDAYRALERIADFLGKIEPHSPVPYLLRRAIKWGRMTAQELLQELYENAPDVAQLYRLLGLQPPEESESRW